MANSRILIGSQALKSHGIDRTHPHTDHDYFLLKQPEERLKGVEYFYHPALAQHEWKEEVASLDELYTIKVSHAYWILPNNSWEKHMADIVVLKKAGATLIPELHKTLYHIWEERYGKKQANLEQEPDRFFNPNVDRKYEHDSIHASVAYYEEPLFNKILRDGHEVAVDKRKFDNLTETVKHQLVREEVYATALERRLIPTNYRLDPTTAYKYALQQLITSYSKGWFATFVVENYGHLKRPDRDYVAYHKQNSHLLIPHIP